MLLGERIVSIENYLAEIEPVIKDEETIHLKPIAYQDIRYPNDCAWGILGATIGVPRPERCGPMLPIAAKPVAFVTARRDPTHGASMPVPLVIVMKGWAIALAKFRQFAAYATHCDQYAEQTVLRRTRPFWNRLARKHHWV